MLAEELMAQAAHLEGRGLFYEAFKLYQQAVMIPHLAALLKVAEGYEEGWYDKDILNPDYFSAVTCYELFLQYAPEADKQKAYGALSNIEAQCDSREIKEKIAWLRKKSLMPVAYGQPLSSTTCITQSLAVYAQVATNSGACPSFEAVTDYELSTTDGVSIATDLEEDLSDNEAPALIVSL